jgi:excisionase family DNA binding protein
MSLDDDFDDLFGVPTEKRDVQMLKIEEVADLLKLSRQHVYNLINAGELRRVKFGKAARIPLAELSRLIKYRMAVEAGKGVKK